MQFHFHVNQSRFHKNGFTLRLALKQAQGNSEMAYSMGIVIITQFFVLINLLGYWSRE